MAPFIFRTTRGVSRRADLSSIPPSRRSPKSDSDDDSDDDDVLSESRKGRSQSNTIDIDIDSDSDDDEEVRTRRKGGNQDDSRNGLDQSSTTGSATLTSTISVGNNLDKNGIGGDISIGSGSSQGGSRDGLVSGIGSGIVNGAQRDPPEPEVTDTTTSVSIRTLTPLVPKPTPSAASTETARVSVTDTAATTVVTDASTVVIVSTVMAPAEPVVTTFIPLMSAIDPQGEAANAARKGLESETLPFTSNIGFTSVTLIPSLMASGTALPATNPTGVPNGQNKGSKDDGAMDPTAQHALIGSGSIGVFVLIGFLGWFIWRSLKKRRGAEGGDPSIEGPLPNRFLNKIPFFNRRVRAWQNLEGSSAASVRDVKPTFDPSRGMAATAPGFYPPNPSYTHQHTASLPGAPQMGGAIARSNTVGSVYSSRPGQAANRTVDGPAMSEVNGNRRSDIIDSYYTLPDISRNPSSGYDAARKQGSRDSQVSSLSSGFGDFDMVVPPQQPPPAQVDGSYGQATARFSWVSRNGGRRETVYTETSEDSPPKFRSISSWVNQQSGRVRRAAARQDDDIPPVPGMPVPGLHQMPPEQRFNMMEDDGEVPRRPDTMSPADTRR